jgi:hydrogenase expression/formation protein HypE
LAATLNEIAGSSQVGIIYAEEKLPVARHVAAACEILGMDPIYVANEGKLVAFVPADQADSALEAMRSQPEGERAVILGDVVAAHPGIVVATTGIGGTRVVDTQIGEQLPRIC